MTDLWKSITSYRDSEKMGISRNFVSSDDAMEHHLNQFYLERADAGAHTISTKMHIIVSSKKEWRTFIESFMDEVGYSVQMIQRKGGYIHFVDPEDENDALIMTYTEGYEGTQLRLLGAPWRVESMQAMVAQTFDEVKCTIEWYYSADGDSTTVPLSTAQMPVQEMYPWMTQSLEDYYEEFMRSNASILLLIGPPGTGKTTWIRGLLNHTETNAIVTYDPAILQKDYIFSQFISGDRDVMIVEDADTHLRPRDDGNDLMARFLNVGSGLVSNGKKKLIFSTNLPNISNVDEALVRPGRCFDVLQFSGLDSVQAQALIAKLGIDIKSDSVYNSNKIPVSEIFNNAKPRQRKSKVGFI